MDSNQMTKEELQDELNTLMSLIENSELYELSDSQLFEFQQRIDEYSKMLLEL